jgi:hypothetical protein
MKKNEKKEEEALFSSSHSLSFFSILCLYELSISNNMNAFKLYFQGLAITRVISCIAARWIIKFGGSFVSVGFFCLKYKHQQARKFKVIDLELTFGSLLEMNGEEMEMY